MKKVKDTRTKLEKEWEELPANRRDGFYGENGLEHSKAYNERLEFIKEKIKEALNNDDVLRELNECYPDFMK